MPTSLLITGATGKQGGSVVSALLSSPAFSPATTKIYALTRSPNSASALRLAAKSSSISLIRGDLSNVPAIFASLPSPPSGVFSVQLPGKGEVAQGKGLIDEAMKAGVKKFVYASVDRGGEKSKDNPTEIAHFKSKHEIEEYLKLMTKGSERKMSYTILRPVFFLDNLEWGFLGKIIATAWKISLPPKKKLQVIATSDIEPFGAAALLELEHPTWENKAFSLAGDELTFEEANETFKEKTGREIPTTYGLLARMALWTFGEIGTMFRWFAADGFGADVGKLRGLDAGRGLKNFGAWAEASQYGKQRS